MQLVNSYELYLKERKS